MRYRNKTYGTKQRPRLSVCRTNRHIYAQIIDDTKGATLAAANSLQIDKDKLKNKTGLQIAKEVGKLIAKQAKTKKIDQVVFDKKSYKYHGRVKKLAEAAKEGSLEF